MKVETKLLPLEKKAIIHEYCVLTQPTTNCLSGPNNNSATPINTLA